jgi:uncharacterized protein (TIGR00369 family)
MAAQISALELLERAPYAVALGLKIESAARGEATARMPFGLRLLNEGGESAPIHGGAIASLVDFAACAAVWSMPETERTATISMTVNYVRPGVKSDLIAHAAVRHTSRRTASLAVEVRGGAGALIADALVTYKTA